MYLDGQRYWEPVLDISRKFSQAQKGQQSTRICDICKQFLLCVFENFPVQIRKRVEIATENYLHSFPLN